ncbi:MAG: FAD-binding domain-containing protein [Jiangellales bacterium]
MTDTSASSSLPTPEVGDEVAWVRSHLADLAAEDASSIRASTSFRGGQSAADAALASFDVTGYARARNEVWPQPRRGASRLSPYIRHNLLCLPRVWDHVDGGPPRDVAKYRDELLWQEYARHLYARLGPALSRPLRHLPRESHAVGNPWDRRMACVDLAVTELEQDGWLVNQTRMWLASQWTVRAGWRWRDGEDAFFAHLLDGSRAANRLGWQWTVGTGTGRPYGFSRHQVTKRAPGLCQRCALSRACPIEDWPTTDPGPTTDPPPGLRHDVDLERTAGPSEPQTTGRPEAVWLTAESLGCDDPALAAHPDLPAVFVFDDPLLRRLRLSGKRLVFLAETLSELARWRRVEVHRGDPRDVLTGRALAVTFAPVPGFAHRARVIAPVAIHPYPWLRRPGAGPLTSFSAWRKHLPGRA